MGPGPSGVCQRRAVQPGQIVAELHVPTGIQCDAWCIEPHIHCSVPVSSNPFLSCQISAFPSPLYLHPSVRPHALYACLPGGAQGGQPTCPILPACLRPRPIRFGMPSLQSPFLYMRQGAREELCRACSSTVPSQSRTTPILRFELGQNVQLLSLRGRVIKVRHQLEQQTRIVNLPCPPVVSVCTPGCRTVFHISLFPSPSSASPSLHPTSPPDHGLPCLPADVGRAVRPRLHHPPHHPHHPRHLPHTPPLLGDGP